MKISFFLFFAFIISHITRAQETIFEKSNGLETATYTEGIQFYKKLAEKYSSVKLKPIGLTDSGSPLHLVTWTKKGASFNSKNTPDQIKILINNAIHPGEPDGVEASMALIRDLANGKISFAGLENIVIGVVPFYNIGGVLNRNGNSRVNQNGPLEHGFRGNSRNYDLNRDFIKMDSRNAESFSKIFHGFNPDIFVDTHVSNGADYQYTLTIIETQKDKIGKPLGHFIHHDMTPKLISKLEKEGVLSVPFVNIYGRAPDEGYPQFMDYPRYSSGYASLFNVISFMTEAHMLKPFEQRVKATYEFLRQLIFYSSDHLKKIKAARQAQIDAGLQADSLPTDWSLNRKDFEEINFKGYEAEYRNSPVTDTKQLYYNQNNPFEKDIPYYTDYEPKNYRHIPEYYIVPEAWFSSIKAQMDHNQIIYKSLSSDSLFKVVAYRIESYETYNSPYEGHYPHYNTEVREEIVEKSFKKGSILISTRQNGLKYIFYCLEPETTDSYFNWNFFDTILQRKEYFSSYVFDLLASEILRENPNLKMRFEEKKATDSSFKASSNQQLDFIYKNSVYYEDSHLLYPVFKSVSGKVNK
ncbi:MAG: hypothetical protein AAF363_01915 [Bacteroidota bacterium]